MPGARRRVTLNAPRTLTAKMRSHSSPPTSRKGVGEVMPALLTRAPTGGSAPSRAARALSTEVSSVMSQPTPTACTRLRSATSVAASLALASSRSRIATFQPAAARVWAVARPMPRLEPAPVMTAVLSETDMVLLQGSDDGGGEWTASGRGRGGVGGPGGVPAAAQLGLDAGDDGVGGQAVAVVQGGQGAGGEELVGQGDGHHAGAHTGEGQRRGDGLGQAADDGVVLQRDH